ncbi:hypothetical protein R3I93_011797 [Phoxinus phoxinus]|uniref:Uncharacterized protein n=1 Tax=Phoxinus phoxinus TaxID=58324 RepID=A0AAN9CX90_9TELE
MSGKEMACFSGAAQHSSQSRYPSYNYTSLLSLASNVPVAWRTREVALSYSYTTLNRRELKVTGLSSPRLANASLVLRKSSLSPSEPKLDKDDNSDGDNGDNTDYDEEDGDDEPSKPHSAGSERAW